MKTYVYLWSYVAQLFLEWEMFQTEVVGKIKTHFEFIFLNRKSYRLLDNAGKYCRARQVTDDNMAHVQCMLGN